MSIVSCRLQYNFTETQKAAMVAVLDKYAQCPRHHSEIRECLRVPGDVVLFRDEALYLAGIVQMYYQFLGDKLRNHPEIGKDTTR